MFVQPVEKSPPQGGSGPGRSPVVDVHQSMMKDTYWFLNEPCKNLPLVGILCRFTNHFLRKVINAY